MPPCGSLLKRLTKTNTSNSVCIVALPIHFTARHSGGKGDLTLLFCKSQRGMRIRSFISSG